MDQVFHRTDRAHSRAALVVGLCAGAAIGAGLALAFAPRSGPQLRRGVSDAAVRAADAISLLLIDANEGSRRVYSHAREGLARIGEAFDGAVKTRSERLDSVV